MKMRIAYIVSMFPCWSETFILNELISHHQSGIDLSIYSLKKFNEKMIHDEAIPFIQKTTYPYNFFDLRLWFLHIFLFITSMRVYTSVLSTILSLSVKDSEVKLKSIIVFLLSPRFVMTAKSQKIEHLHAHFATYPAILAWIIKCFTDIPFSVTVHAHDIFINQDLLPIICENVDAIIAISEFNKKFIINKVGSKYEDKIEVIHCGINLNRFSFNVDRSYHNRKDISQNILSIGRLCETKGFPYLLEAIKLLIDDGVKVSCRIIGDGHMRGELLNQVKKLGIMEKVKFLGAKKTEEIPRFLQSADVFVLPCVIDKKEGQDGIPLVFMEAMAYGTPVIGTWVSGIPELIIHKQTGLCANPEDPISLKNNLQYLIDNPIEVNKIRYNARALVEKEFNIEKTSQQLRELFTHIIKTKSVV